MDAHASDRNRISVLKTGQTVSARSFFSEKYDAVLKIAPGQGGQVNFVDVCFPAANGARYPDQGMLYYHKTTDDTPPWIINGRYCGGNHGGVVVKRREYLVDGRVPLPDDTFTRCAFLDIVEEQDITRTVNGKSEVLVSSRIIYRLQPYAACTIEHYATVRRDCRIDLWALTQAMVLSGGDLTGHDQYLPRAFDAHDYYIPKTRPFVRDGKRFDFSRPEDYRQAPVPLRFDASMLEDAGNPPERFVQLLGRDGTYQLGFVCGYSLVAGVTRPAERARHCRIPVELSGAKKTYPHALEDLDAPAGTELYGLAYRQYFDPSAFPGPTAAYWHRQGESWLVYLDYHRAAARDVIALPAHLSNQVITVVEKTPGVQLHTGPRVPVGGIELTVTGDGGHLVLKLDEP